jgi:hypothetical protein
VWRAAEAAEGPFGTFIRLTVTGRNVTVKMERVETLGYWIIPAAA